MPERDQRVLRRRVGALALLAGALASLAGCEGDTTGSPPNGDRDATTVDAAHGDAPGEAARDGGDAGKDTSTAAPDAVASEGNAGMADSAAPAQGDASADATTPLDSTGAATPDVTKPPALVALRVANWAPDAPAVDFCLAAHNNASFQGPVLAGRVDGGAVGLALTQSCATTAAALTASACPVSSYVLIKAGSYDLRFVAPQGDCSVPIVPDTQLPMALVGGSAVTLALVGKLHPSGSEPGPKVIQLTDDVVAGGDTVPLRFVHAAPTLGSTSMDLALGSQPVFSAVPFGQPSTKVASGPDGGLPAADTNGYVAVPSFMGVSLSVQAHGGTADGSAPSQVSSSATSAAAGGVVTVTLVTGATGPQLWECVDNAGTVGSYSTCFSISP